MPGFTSCSSCALEFSSSCDATNIEEGQMCNISISKLTEIKCIVDLIVYEAYCANADASAAKQETTLGLTARRHCSPRTRSSEQVKADWRPETGSACLQEGCLLPLPLTPSCCLRHFVLSASCKRYALVGLLAHKWKKTLEQMTAEDNIHNLQSKTSHSTLHFYTAI